MTDEIVIRCCAPTLAAIKTGSLFNASFGSPEEMTATLREMNRCFVCKGVSVLPLRWRSGTALLYLYRPAMLQRDLRDPLAAEILRRAGYPKTDTARQIAHLIRRLKECDSFPHEIGLFLGYPAVDVRGFIEHKACKSTGVWKVYESDEAEAERIFARCRHCTEAFLRRNREGWSLARLTIRKAPSSACAA
ncbi:MAG: DUF3793 family protein [Clostridia bacterium]|nr:DUF3793 family protein [Clostridia bacterium]